MTDQEKQARFEAAIEAAFEKHKTKVGGHWNYDFAIDETRAEDFAREIFSILNIQF